MLTAYVIAVYYSLSRKSTDGRGRERGHMDEEKPVKRQTTKLSRAERAKRIVERLREGFGCDEIAREEGVSERRVQQIVKEALEGREALESAFHAHMQVDRAGRALRVAGEALAEGDVRAVAPFLKAMETPLSGARAGDRPPRAQDGRKRRPRHAGFHQTDPTQRSRGVQGGSGRRSRSGRCAGRNAGRRRAAARPGTSAGCADPGAERGAGGRRAARAG